MEFKLAYRSENIYVTFVDPLSMYGVECTLVYRSENVRFAAIQI